MFWSGVIQLSDWKQLAIEEANFQKIRADIVLATIEAETGGRNVLGDNGNALGYGQVWPKWHQDKFNYAGSRLGIAVPTDLINLSAITLNNNKFSMIVAVRTIKSFWDNSNNDWGVFTRGYVGQGISDVDFKRREKIWDKYRSTNLTANITYSSSTTNADSNLSVDATNFGVLNNSAKLGNVLYGRKYRIIVSDRSGNALDVSDLRCKFRCIKTMLTQPDISEIVIYNLNAQTENSIIDSSARVVLEAGYVGEQYGVIFDGEIVQTIREKEDGTDFKLTLIALDGDRFINTGLANFTLVKGQTKRDIIQKCVSSASIPSQLGSISGNISSSKLTRGKVVFGLASDYLRQVAQGEKGTVYVENGKVNLIKANDLPTGEVIELSPTSGLIGVPSQTDQGVSCKCLINPQLKTNTFIKIDNSLVRSQRIDTSKVYGTTTQPLRPLDNDGLYRIIKITYDGDTRGDNWYCDMEAISQAGLIPSIMINPEVNPW